MTKTVKPSGQAVDDAVSEVLKFSPASLWRTFMTVRRSGWKGDQALADAIAAQDWTAILSPMKFVGAASAAALIIAWAYDSFAHRHLTKFSTISFLDPEFLPLILWPVAAAPLLHLILSFGASKDKLVDGLYDGSVKIFQLLMYGLGNFFFFFSPLFIVILFTQTGMLSAYSLPIDLIIGFLSAILILYPLIFLNIPTVISKLYSVNWTRSVISLYAVTFFLYVSYSLIIIGKLPDD